MKRELIKLKKVDCCCPCHDNYPADTYRNRRSKRKRKRGKTIEHKYVRTLVKRYIIEELHNG